MIDFKKRNHIPLIKQRQKRDEMMKIMQIEKSVITLLEMSGYQNKRLFKSLVALQIRRARIGRAHNIGIINGANKNH